MGHYASEMDLGPGKPLTDEKRAAIRRSAVRAVTQLKLRHAAEGLRELGYDTSADTVETIAKELTA